jgi:hypothetical protein
VLAGNQAEVSHPFSQRGQAFAEKDSELRKARRRRSLVPLLFSSILHYKVVSVPARRKEENAAVINRRHRPGVRHQSGEAAGKMEGLAVIKMDIGEFRSPYTSSYGIKVCPL